MERHPNDLTTDEEIDAAITEANGRDDVTILEAAWHRTADFAFLMMKLSNGRRVLIPREDLTQLGGATDEQASDFFIGQFRDNIWWPQVDEGLLLSNWLRDHPAEPAVQTRAAEERRGVAA